eukprot:Em0004g594a
MAALGGNASMVGDVLFTVTNGASVLVCLLAAILVFALRLHRSVVYRLALYQVLAALAFAMVDSLQIIFINYQYNPKVYGRVCTLVGWLVTYTEWLKLVFTVCVTFHLFCFGALHKNLKKFEVLYVTISLLVPALVAAVPLITHTYGSGPLGTVCYIFVSNDSYKSNVAFAERIALWDGPALVILLAASVAMAVMVIKLARRVCKKRSTTESDTDVDHDQFWKAIKHLLPLATFPVLFFIFVIPGLIFDFHTAQTGEPNMYLATAVLIFVSMWSMASGASLLIHISVARLWHGKSVSHKPVKRDLDQCERSTNHADTVSYVNSNTSFHPQISSFADE